MEESFALAVDLNHPSHQTRLLREDVAISFGSKDLSGGFESAEDVLKFLLLTRLKQKQVNEARDIGRNVVRPPEQF